MIKSDMFSGRKMTKKSIKKLKGWGVFGVCAVLVIMIIQMYMVAPVEEEREELETRIQRTTQTIKAYRKKVTQIPEIQKELDGRKKQLDRLLKKYPKGVKSETVERQLNKKFLSLHKYGLKTTSFLPLVAKKRTGFLEVSFKFNFKADINGLAVFLENLKGFKVPVSVKDIQIQVTRDDFKYPLKVSVVLETLLRQ